MIFTKQLNVFSDIFYIALQNVVAHSGLRSPKVDITVQYSSEVVRIGIESEIEPSRINPEVAAKLNRIRHAIHSDQFVAGVRIEGGSGLMKLRKIVGDSLGDLLDFGFRPDHMFFVSIPLRIIAESPYRPE